MYIFLLTVQAFYRKKNIVYIFVFFLLMELSTFYLELFILWPTAKSQVYTLCDQHDQGISNLTSDSHILEFFVIIMYFCICSCCAQRWMIISSVLSEPAVRCDAIKLQSMCIYPHISYKYRWAWESSRTAM